MRGPGTGPGLPLPPTTPFRQAHTPVHPHIEHTHTYTPIIPLAPRSESGKTKWWSRTPNFRLPHSDAGPKGRAERVHPPTTSIRQGYPAIPPSTRTPFLRLPHSFLRLPALPAFVLPDLIRYPGARAGPLSFTDLALPPSTHPRTPTYRTHTPTPYTPPLPDSESGKTSGGATLLIFVLPGLDPVPRGQGGATLVYRPRPSARHTHPVHPYRTHTHLHPYNPPGSPIGVGEDEWKGCTPSSTCRPDPVPRPARPSFVSPHLMRGPGDERGSLFHQQRPSDRSTHPVHPHIEHTHLHPYNPLAPRSESGKTIVVADMASDEAGTTPSFVSPQTLLRLPALLVFVSPHPDAGPRGSAGHVHPPTTSNRQGYPAFLSSYRT